MASSLDDIIDNLGFGKFGMKLVIIVGIYFAADGAEITLISLIAPVLKCKWNLSDTLSSLTSSSVFLGMGVGSVYWGWLADKFGRKKFMIMAGGITFYFGILCAAAPDYSWFLILRFFTGVGIAGLLFSTVYLTEFMPTKHRGKAVSISALWFSFGGTYVALLGYLINSVGWRYFLLLTTLPMSLCLLLSSWLPESIRYLLNTGNHIEILGILDRISADNKVEIHSDIALECKPSSKRGDIWMLSDKKYRVKMVIMILTWITGLGFYYGIVLLSTKIFQVRSFCRFNKTIELNTCHKLTDQDHLANVIVALGDWPGIIICTLVTDRIGRKNIIMFGYVFIAICLVFLNLCLSDTFITIIMFIMKATAAGVTQTNWLYAAEIFPNVIRATALGVLNALTRWSLILIPFAFQTLTHVSLLIMAVVCLLNVTLCLLLPETKGERLTNT